MKAFNLLYEGLDYQKICPICKNECVIDHEGLVSQYNPDNSIISLETGIADDIININSTSNSVELITNSPSAYNGLAHHRVQIECFRCMSYGYTLQLTLNMNSPPKIFNIFLNSEFLCFYNAPKFLDHYRIKNSYSLQTTYVMNNEYSKALQLINFNLINPQETIDKIKNIIPFL